MNHCGLSYAGSLNAAQTIRPGFRVRVIVTKDLVLRPYQPLLFERSKP